MTSRNLLGGTIVVGAALFASALPNPATAQTSRPAPPEFIIDVGGWTGGAQGDQASGRFSHCGISRQYGNGLSLVFLLSPRFEMNIGIVNPAWTLLTQPAPVDPEADEDEDEPPVASVEIDGVYSREFGVRPISDTVLMVNTGVDEQLVELLMRGNTLDVGTDQGSHRFALSGTFDGLTALRGCIDTARRLAAASRPGGAGQPINGQVLAGILRDAGLQGAAVTPWQREDNPLGLRFAWTVGPLLGGVHQTSRGEPVAIDQFADSYINRFAATCGGDFRKSVDNAEILRDRYAMKTATLQCGGDRQGTVVSLFIALDDHFYTAFFHQGEVGDRVVVIDATDQIRQVVRQQAGG